MSSEPVGTKVNLREALSPEGLKTTKKGDILHYQMDDGTETWIKVTRAGFWRYEGEIIAAPLTVDEYEEMEKKVDMIMKESERQGIIPRSEGDPEPNHEELLVDPKPPTEGGTNGL